MKDYVLLIGYFGSDPKITLKNTKKGAKEYCSFSFMTFQNNFRKFHPCSAWENTARIIFDKMKKGMFATIEGSLNYNQWLDEHGGNHTRAEVVVQKIYFGKEPDE